MELQRGANRPPAPTRKEPKVQHPATPKTEDHAPMTLTISGRLAAEIRRAARELGWTTEQAVEHVVADLAAQMDVAGLWGVEYPEDGPADPRDDDTWVTLDNA